MSEPNSDVFKYYAIHTFLQSFSQSVLVTFGALFIYAKTGSIGIALAAEFAGITADLIIRSPFVEIWWNRWLGRRQVLAMMVGMAITALASMGIFFTDTSLASASFLLILLAGLSSIGTSVYWIPSNAAYFRAVGPSSTPGYTTSLLTILRIAAAILAAIVSLLLNAQNHFLVLLPILAIIALLSLIPLQKLRLPLEEPVSWKRSVTRMSKKSFWANFLGDNQLRTTGVPLVLVLLYGSFSKPAAIGALTLLFAAILGYFAGKLKDGNKSSLFTIALIGAIFVWIAYAFIKAPLAFVILGTLEYIFSTILNVGRDARLGREAANTGHFVESALAVELTRALGTMAGLLVLILAYWTMGSLPQFVLLTGILFVVPRGLYAIGILDELKLIPD
jgi:MFS family permease